MSFRLTNKAYKIIAIDQLKQIPLNTVAREQAENGYQAYSRDFRQISGLVAGNNRTSQLRRGQAHVACNYTKK